MAQGLRKKFEHAHRILSSDIALAKSTQQKSKRHLGEADDSRPERTLPVRRGGQSHALRMRHCNLLMWNWCRTEQMLYTMYFLHPRLSVDRLDGSSPVGASCSAGYTPRAQHCAACGKRRLRQLLKSYLSRFTAPMPSLKRCPLPPTSSVPDACLQIPQALPSHHRINSIQR